MRTPLIFDGHNDLVSSMYASGVKSSVEGYLDGRSGHVDREKLSRGGFGGGLFALWAPSKINFSNIRSEMRKPAFDIPLPEPVAQAEALEIVLEQLSLLKHLVDVSNLQVCTTVDELSDCFSDQETAVVIHLEGGEAIDPEFKSLELLWQSGLRSLGPVWSRDSVFGTGVPLRYPSTGNIGTGLSDLGKDLIEKCNELRIAVDLSHMNENGFWDVAEISNAPLLATHSNAHSLCPHSRNLTDAQMKAIANSGGMIGVNFSFALLRDDDGQFVEPSMIQILRQLDYMIKLMGEDHVGFGSDFDGAIVPDDIRDASGLAHLRIAMVDHGYSAELIEKNCYLNWFRVLRDTWGQPCSRLDQQSFD